MHIQKLSKREGHLASQADSRRAHRRGRCAMFGAVPASTLLLASTRQSWSSPAAMVRDKSEIRRPSRRLTKTTKPSRGSAMDARAGRRWNTVVLGSTRSIRGGGRSLRRRGGTDVARQCYRRVPRCEEPRPSRGSSLEHVLRDHRTMHEHQTMPADRGIFLPETRRLAPAICQFTSELFYEGRLHSLPGLERQVLTGAAPFDGRRSGGRATNCLQAPGRSTVG